MVEETTVQRLIESINTGDWASLVGVILLVLVAFARRLVAVRDTLPARAKEIISAAAAVVAGVAVSLLAGADWLGAVLLGTIAGSASAGLWDILLRLERRT